MKLPVARRQLFLVMKQQLQAMSVPPLSLFTPTANKHVIRSAVMMLFSVGQHIHGSMSPSALYIFIYDATQKKGKKREIKQKEQRGEKRGGKNGKTEESQRGIKQKCGRILCGSTKT